MDNIGSIRYRPEMNQVYLKTRKTISFYERFNPENINLFLSIILKGIVPVENLEDVHLEAFLASNSRLKKYKEDVPLCLSLVIYPVKGEISEFILNSKSEFFSDIHRNVDPLTIKELKHGLHVHPKKTDDYVWIDYNNQSAPNRISGGILFKTDPIKHPKKYPGFSKFKSLNPNDIRDEYPPE